MKKCPKCGAEGEGKFCDICGAEYETWRKALVDVIAIIAVIVFVIWVLSNGCKVTANISAPTAETSIESADSQNIQADEQSPGITVPPKEAAINEAITVGDIKATAGTPEKKSSLDEPYDNMNAVTANGVFIVVPLTVELLGKTKGAILSDQLAIIDSSNRTFSADANGLANLAVADKLIFNQTLNPNVPVKAVVVFDIAKDARGLRLGIRDNNAQGYVDLGI